MRRYFQWAFVIAIAVCGAGNLYAQQAAQSPANDEAEIVPAPEDLVDKSDDTDVDRLSGSGIIDEQMIERLRGMTLSDLLSEARRLIDEEQIREAAPYVAVARERDPRNFEVTVMLGEMALLNGEIQPAREKLLEAYRANRNDYRAAVGLGRLYLATRRYRQAVNYLEQAEEVAPLAQVARAQRYLAEAYLGSGLLIKARDVAQRAVDAEPDGYDPRRVLATVLIAVRDLDQALVHVQALERIARDEAAANPGDLRSLQRLIQAWAVHQQALRERLGELVVVGPDGVPTDEVLPTHKAEAAKITRRMVELLLRQNEANRMAKLFEIVEVSEQTLVYAPDSSSHWHDHGLLLLETQQYEPAYKAFEKAVELDPANSSAQDQLNKLKAVVGLPATPSDSLANPAETPVQN